MLQQAISISLLAAMAATPPAISQGIGRNSSINGSAAYVAPAIRVLVATPYPSTPADSVSAVTVGTALRTKLSNNIGGSDWAIISRREMNDNLANKWGYSPDQIFNPETARQLVTALQARIFVMTTMIKGPDGQFTAQVRVVGSSDDAGQVIKLSQLPAQNLTDFGNKLAEQLSAVFKAYPDAKACRDQETTNKVKAGESATKAVKQVPNYGFAEYCLGELEQMKDPVGAETVRHFANAIVGDPLSLKGVNQLAVIHAKKNDTSAVVADYLQMLQIAPTNRELADQSVKVFKGYNRPDAAEAVIDMQIKNDPSSADWPELKGNLCAAAAVGSADPAIAKAKFKCAYEQFLAVYNLDITRADTNFYPRMVFVAGNRPDSMLWVKRWIDKYPSITDPYKVQLQMYMDVGQSDSAMKIAKMLTTIDPTDVKPLLAIEIALLNDKKYDDAIALAPNFKAADETAKNQYAGLLVTFADSASRRTPQDDSAMVKLGRAVVAFNPPNTQYIDFGHYFIVRGLAAGFAPISAAARADKSCETVKRYVAYLDQFEPSVVIVAASTNGGLADYGKQVNTQVQAERKFIPDLEKAYCKAPTKP